jgi:hypothetical protein
MTEVKREAKNRRRYHSDKRKRRHHDDEHELQLQREQLESERYELQQQEIHWKLKQPQSNETSAGSTSNIETGCASPRHNDLRPKDYPLKWIVILRILTQQTICAQQWLLSLRQ